MSILDLGCDLGQVVDLIARNNQNIIVSSSNIIKKAIKIAKKNLRNIIFLSMILLPTEKFLIRNLKL